MGCNELDVLAVVVIRSSRNGHIPPNCAARQGLTPTRMESWQIRAAKAAFPKQFQRDRAKLAAMGIAIESRQPEYSSSRKARTSRPITVCSQGRTAHPV